MAVKRSQSALRVLAVLDVVAKRQPIGVSEIAKGLGEDLSAVHRAIATLADDGWIAVSPDRPKRWELSSRLFGLAHLPSSVEELRQRSRLALEDLRASTGESVLLVVPDSRNFLVIEVLQSHQPLRTVPEVGNVVPPRESATGHVLLPHFSHDRQAFMLGAAPDAKQIAAFEATVATGYAVSVGEVMPGSTNLAAPIFNQTGQAVAAIVVSAPTDRLPASAYPTVGAMAIEAARAISRAPASRKASP